MRVGMAICMLSSLFSDDHCMSINLLSQLGVKGALDVMACNWAAVNLFYYLEYRLNGTIPLKPLRRGYSIRKAEPADIERLQTSLPGLNVDDRKALITRILFYRRGIKGCFLVNDAYGEPAFIQWLVLPEDNEVLSQQYPGRFPKLKPDDAFIENAFCFPRHRALGWLPEVTQRLMNHAGKKGAKRCLALIRVDNLPALNTFTSLGFRIRQLVHETKLLGRARRQFERKQYESAA